MSSKKKRITVFSELFSHFLDTTLANREVPHGGLWGQWGTGLAEVPFQCLPCGNAAHTAFHRSSSSKSLPRVRKELDVKMNLTHWQPWKWGNESIVFVLHTFAKQCQKSRTSCSQNTLVICVYNSVCVPWTAHGSPFFPFLEGAGRNQDILVRIF